MRFAKALPLLALLLLASPAVRATDQPDAAALAKARELVDASMVPGSSEQMVGAISGSVAQLILSVNPGKEEQIGPVVDAYFTPLLREHFSELSEVPATAFAKTFTADELDQLLAFYRSPLGKKYLDAQAKVQTDMMTQGPDHHPQAPGPGDEEDGPRAGPPGHEGAELLR